jgi:DNA-binding LacI/PurR family transcriptional regulator
MLIGVVAAEADNIEQRQILTGIISQAQELELDIAVFTNIYNPNVPDAEVSCENRIYDLILSPDLNALILISESIVNTELQQFIKQRLLAQCHLPIVIIGTPLPDFDIPNARFINTSDVRDITALTNHLIDVHGFTDIDLLTGYDFLEVSRLRVSGYRQALEQHGIPYHEEKVHFGNFWMNTGQELAEKYSSGELPLPQAVVCANDYMAYGLLDAFAELNIRVPEDVTVVGYEYINQRIFHAPILTTYQRNRKEIGRQAVRILHSLLTTGTELPFVPPDGRLISGGSCCCGAEDTELQQELRSCRTNDFFSHMNIYNQMEHRLTECSSLHDFIRICGKSHYLIRDAHDIFLCLSEDWCDGETGSTSDIMSCRSIVPWRADEPAVTFHRQQISVVCGDAAAVYYFTPLFFSDRLFPTAMT